MRPYQPSMLWPGTVRAPSLRDFGVVVERGEVEVGDRPHPSQRGHIPPRRVKVAFSVLVLPPRSDGDRPVAFTEGTLNE